MADSKRADITSGGGMGRSEQPVADGPLKDFAEDLRALRRTTGMTYRALARRAGYSYSVLSAAAGGAGLPTLPVTLAYVGACGGDQDAWETRWTELAALLRATSPGLLPPEVHEPPPPQAAPEVEGGPEADPSRPGTTRTDFAEFIAVPQVESLGSGDPRRIGPFRTIGRLGGGAMGEVYLAASPAGRPVAVKLVLAQLARDPVFRRRFAREVQAARTVPGGHSPVVVDADVEAERPWLATAYIPGPSLGDAVGTYGRLPEPVVLGLAAGVAEALGAFHAAGIVHRDLKPSNVLLADDGPKVIDFGISRALEGTALTATGTPVGTAGFMAPEQAEGREIGPAADVFALGCLLAYAATGITPFGDGPSAGVLYRIVHDKPNKDALACQDKQLRALIERCLDKDPAARPTPAQIVKRVGGGSRIGTGWLPAALAAQIARRSAHAATLIDHAARRRTVVRVQLGLVPLLLILAIVVTVLLGGHHSSPGTLTGPEPGPGIVTDPDTGVSSEPTASTGTGSPSAPNGGNSPAGAPSGPGAPIGSSGPVDVSGQAGTDPAGGNPGRTTAGAAATSASKATSAASPAGSTSAPKAAITPPGTNPPPVVPTTSAPPPSSAKFSFDDGTEGWNDANNSDIVVAPATGTAHDGLGSLRLTDTASDSSTYVAAVSPALSSGPSSGSHISAWIYLPGGSGQTVKAKLYVQDPNGKQSFPGVTTLTAGWNQLTYTPSGTGTITRVGVQFNKNQSTQLMLYLDTFTWS